MKKLKNTLKDLILIIIFIILLILLLATFFSPFIISFITGNWWFIFLFTVTWIPTWFEVLIIGIIAKLL